MGKNKINKILKEILEYIDDIKENDYFGEPTIYEVGILKEFIKDKMKINGKP